MKNNFIFKFAGIRLKLLLFIFVKILLQVQTTTYIKMRSSSQVRKRNNETVQKYGIIKEEYIKYQNDPSYSKDCKSVQ